MAACPSCRHLEYKRPGGRASARFGDTVRRRLWRRRQGANAAAAPAVAVPGAAEGGAAAAVAAAGEEEGSGAAVAAAAALAARDAAANQKAIRQFIAMVLDVLRCECGARLCVETPIFSRIRCQLPSLRCQPSPGGSPPDCCCSRMLSPL